MLRGVMCGQLTLAGLVISLSASVAVGQGALIWADEFNGTSLSAGNWEPMIGNGCSYGICGWGNNEQQYYTGRPDNVFVAGGYLHIVAREENYQGHDYTSARIRSLNRWDFQYGIIEARIRLPQGGAGIWPAFWMLPTNSPYGGWAAGGEIDILETVGVPTVAHGTLHFGGAWPNNVSSGGSYSPGGSFGDDFHVYRLEWRADEMRWFIDGVHYLTLTSNDWYSDAAPGNNQAPFDNPFHFLLNVAVGGNWPGPPNASTPFPQEMLVDWVRVYGLVPNDAPTVTITTPANGAQLPVGITGIIANASDSDGSIDRVEFYADDILIQADTTAPYATGWSATDGCHTLRAEAVDDLGGRGFDEITVRVGAGCTGDPYSGSPVTLPGIVEIENFDNGGEGVAYHDCDAPNNGGAYRPSEAVDLEATNGGGFNLGWMCAGEWLNYAVDISEGGYYRIDARVASQSTGGTFGLELDGVDATGDVTIPATGGWQAWIDVSATAFLSTGLAELRFANRSGSESYNVDRLTFTRVDDLDFDFDGDVDLLDWSVFVGCQSGPESAVPAGTCSPEDFERSDTDGDNDVDLVDVAAFGRGFAP
jgi:beta-glucanase (GH16 family)